MQTSCRTTVGHNSGTRTRGARRTRPRRAEDTINLDTGRIKSRIYSPDTEQDGPVLSRCCPVCRCRTVWVGSSAMAASRQYLSPPTRRPEDRPISNLWRDIRHVCGARVCAWHDDSPISINRDYQGTIPTQNSDVMKYKKKNFL